MTKNQVLESISLKKRFCKDCNIPITIYDNPYFMERLNTINEVFGEVKDKFNLFCKELEKFEDEQSYFEYYNSIKESIIQNIVTNDKYREFNSSSALELTNSVVKYPKKNLYIEENNDCAFISIDMNKANFSALKYYSNEIFNNADTWEDYISQFTDSQHIIESKYIRQVILGACNPARQIRYEHWLMNSLAVYLRNTYPTLEIYSLATDEIIIKVENDKPLGVSLNELKEKIANEPTGIGKLVKVKYFHLSKIDHTKGWMKNYSLENKIDIKCLEPRIYHQVLKYFLGKEITEDDLTFYYEGELARLLKPIINPFN